MKYAVELYFDEKSEAFLQSLVQSVADAGLSTTFLDYQSRPHLTLACYNDVDEADCMEKLKAFAAAHKPLPAYTGSLGIFHDTKTVFAAPLMNRWMYSVQEELHMCLQGLDTRGHEWYTPDRWMPHCTLALLKEDSDEAFYQAVELLLRNFRKTAGTFDHIGLVRITMPVEEIFTVKLGE